MNIAVSTLLLYLFIVQLVNIIYGDSIVPNISKKHDSLEREEDDKDTKHLQSVRKKKHLVKKLEPSFHKTSFERKTDKLHRLASLAFKKLENDERNGYISKLRPSPVRSQKTIRSKHLRKDAKVKNRRHMKKDSKLFRKHTNRIHRMRANILRLLEHNEKKYLLSKINELSHQLD